MPQVGHIYPLRLASNAAKVDVVWRGIGFSIPGKPVVEFRNISEVNLSLMAGNRYDVRNYMCRMWTTSGEKVFLRANANSAEECLAYREFMKDLHDALLSNGLRPKFNAGMRSRAGYRMIQILFLVMFLGLAGTVIFAMATQGKVLLGILMLLVIIGFGAFFYWLLGATAKPRLYDPADIPSMLLP